MNIAVAYVRVSSKTQDAASQRAAIEREATARGDSIGAWYSEKVSGKSLDRPELARMREDARAGRLGKVYLFRLDRLTRSGVADTFKVVQEFRQAGATIVSVSDALTIKPSEDVTSDVMIFALGLAAKIERTAINERISAARTRVESEGGAWGRPRAIDAATVSKARAMRAAGATVRDVSIALKVKRSTIARALAG